MSTLSGDKPPRLPNVESVTPIERLKALHELADWLEGEQRLAYPVALAYGQANGMNMTEIGASVGRSAAWMYKQAKRARGAGDKPEATTTKS